MSKHRAGVSKHRAGPAHRQPSRARNPHRAEVRPRYGRIVTLTSSLAVTVVAVVGGAGLLPSMTDDTDPASSIDRASSPADETGADLDLTTTPRVEATNEVTDGANLPDTAADVEDAALPAESGQGRRIVFSESRQRVWLVDAASQVVRTYPVSGSIYDNLDPGTFRVYSRSEAAVGIDDSGTMMYFVRFTTGDQGAAIGFHDIPIDEGAPVQSVAELGTPQSHGCIRQRRPDAIALWRFAPIGTTVVVTA